MRLFWCGLCPAKIANAKLACGCVKLFVEHEFSHSILTIIYKKTPQEGRFFINGGEDEIRTHGRFNPTPAFQASALNRSATSPYIWKRGKLTSSLVKFK